MQVAPLSSEEFQAIKKRSDLAWGDRSPWNSLYQDAYDYAVPQRRPNIQNIKGKIEKLYDMTAPMSAMYFAGSLQRDLFPPGQESFTPELGPMTAEMVRREMGPDGIKQANRALDQSTRVVHPFFLTGEWDTSVHEACVDLSIGTAAILPVAGDIRYEPLRFACIPFDQIAIWCDVYGKVIGASWKQQATLEQIRDNWPKANWSKDFKDRAKSRPNQEEDLFQVFWKNAKPGGGWHFLAFVGGTAAPEAIVHERYRTQPIAVPRYYRVPGESYGRGVVLTALPSIKTLNKAQELALKSAAIQMMGIWAYRPGGTFNPNTARFGPGEFWAMQSTGGYLGPDVQRMDAASGSLNVGQMVIGNLQDQVKNSMFDTRLPDYQGTPRAASEIAARLQQKADVHIGAFGRLVHEIMPVVVPRAMEILGDAKILQTPLPIDMMLYSVSVRSPMKAALNADRLASIANYIEFVSMIAGQDKVPLYADIEATLAKVADGFQIDKDLIPNEEKRAQVQSEMEAAQQKQTEMIFAQKAAERAPQAIADYAKTQEAA